jgi:hypothetical protein
MSGSGTLCQLDFLLRGWTDRGNGRTGASAWCTRYLFASSACDKDAIIRALRVELQRGNYNVVHCHHDLLSAVYLLAAAGLPIGRRRHSPRAWHRPLRLRGIREAARAQPRNVFGRMMLDCLRILRLRFPHRRISQAAYRAQRQAARLLAKEIHGDRAQS